MVGNDAVDNVDTLGLKQLEDISKDLQAQAQELRAYRNRCKCYTINPHVVHASKWARKTDSGLNIAVTLEIRATDEAGCNCKCKNIKTVQFVKTKNFALSPARRGRKGAAGWRVDVSRDTPEEPFVSDGRHGSAVHQSTNPSTGSHNFTASVRDSPQRRRLSVEFFEDDEAGLQRTGEIKFRTCAICVDTGKTLGCLEWGYQITKTKNQTKVGAKQFTVLPLKVYCQGDEIADKTSADARAGWAKANGEGHFQQSLGTHKP